VKEIFENAPRGLDRRVVSFFIAIKRCIHFDIKQYFADSSTERNQPLIYSVCNQKVKALASGTPGR
jgi:hypothetical protein